MKRHVSRAKKAKQAQSAEAPRASLSFGEAFKGHVEKRVSLHVISNRVEQIYQDYDPNSAAQRQERGVTPDRIACRKGCAHCCDQLLYVHETEAQTIFAQYPELVGDVLLELLERERELHRLLDSRGLGPEIFDILSRPFDPERTKLLDAWYAKRLPCVFLDRETKACRIYEHRPIACRDHILIDESPSYCDVRDNPDQTTEALVTKASQDAFSQLGELAQEKNGVMRLALFTTMLLQVIQDEKDARAAGFGR